LLILNIAQRSPSTVPRIIETTVRESVILMPVRTLGAKRYSPTVCQPKLGLTAQAATAATRRSAMRRVTASRTG